MKNTKRKTKQTRTQVSIRGATHIKVKEHCAKTGETVSEFVNKLCDEFFMSKHSAA